MKLGVSCGKMDKNLNEKLADLRLEMGSKIEVNTKLQYESNEEIKEGRFQNPPISNDYSVLVPKNAEADEEIKTKTTVEQNKKDNNNMEKKFEKNFKLIPFVSFIRRQQSLFPTTFGLYFNHNEEEFITQDMKIETNQFGNTFQYHPSTKGKEDFHGRYIKYFIRKHLANKYDVELVDRFAEHVIEYPENYQTAKNPKLKEAIKKHYKIYTDKNTTAIDIRYSIKVVSLSRSIFGERVVPRKEFHTYYENLLAIVKYLDSLTYNTMEMYPELNCEYFQAQSVILFDGDVAFEIMVSKYDLSAKRVKYNQKIIQSILHSLSYYKRTGKKIRKLVIYNPLLGEEHVVELKDIDFELLEEALDKDLTAFQSNRLHNNNNYFRILY
ncbi:uncharacterized protein LOC119643217 isoform X1 [Glossina fuscipes]|uniref:Uncharacterized protein LOC119643217 isoform X1 n=2 Tax=Glossina fuscipes TaxID=7396 RepID=A0A9C6DZQ5_9MUSC|nr:uncharacterized protein LOC119643217 isoform X1 [Glossina fuscipes]XP_037898490.1 uncharacterized protein LOC119643217 isoform X1 [Glossina fuscipes]